MMKAVNLVKKKYGRALPGGKRGLMVISDGKMMEVQREKIDGSSLAPDEITIKGDEMDLTAHERIKKS